MVATTLLALALTPAVVARPYVPPAREYSGVLVWVPQGDHNVLGLRTAGGTYWLDFTRASGCAHELGLRAGRPACVAGIDKGDGRLTVVRVRE